MTDFVHLHVHSEYSLLDGLARLDRLVQRAKQLEMSAIALTDHGNMYGAVDFYSAAKSAGIKPILGCEVYVAPDSRHKRQGKAEASPYHLVLLAENVEGYRNIIKLCTLGHLEGFYYKPRVDKELLTQYSKGVIASSACRAGEIARLLVQGDHDAAVAVTKWHQDVFGPESFFLELQNHALPELEAINRGLVQLSRDTGAPLIATNDVHYVNEEDARAQDILLCIQTNSTMADSKRFTMGDSSYFLRTQEQMRELFGEIPESLSNTVRIAERCNVELDFSRVHLPEFAIPEGYNPDTYLEKLCRDGLRQRYQPVTPEADERLRYELSVIKETGFSLYILIVADLVRHARETGILFGPRGSAAGSIVCYCMDISDLDPIANKLVFERFLNIERKEMPDIDMDFADDRRNEMIEYCASKYGRDHVAQIVTFGTLGAKAAIRDVGRALGMPYGSVDNVAKLVPSLPVGITLDKALAERREMKEMYDSDPAIKDLIDSARSIEGVARHSSTHAAGVVISREPLTDHVPLQRASKGEDALMTQYHANSLAKIGLLKMDFLGLANLTILNTAVNIIKRERGITIDLQALPLDDHKVFEMLGNGDTTGLFQLEGVGMRRYIKDLKPTSIHDLAAMVALYRPGPMAHIPRFIRCKAGLDPIEYLHPALEPILSDTYGIIVYQEHVLHIVQKIAGYSLGQADVLRKAMGKKIAEVMKQQRSKFVEGALKNGFSDEEANKIFDLIEPFAGYAFNRAHAYCYAMLAYKTAYLKANYPEEYMVAVLSAASGNLERIAVAAGECRRMGVELLPPDINLSEADFTIESNRHDRAIRFGLGAIKNVGVGAVEAIVSERKKNGPFLSIDDFCQRVDPKTVNKRVLESLAKAGAMSPRLGLRAQILPMIDKMVNLMQQSQRASGSGQATLFDLMATSTATSAINLAPIPEFSSQELLSWEKEFLGTFVSEHPLKSVEYALDDLDPVPLAQISEELVGQTVTIAGLLTNVRVLNTKKGTDMMTATLEDMESSAEVVVFSRALDRYRDVLKPDAIVCVEAKVDSREDKVQLVVQEATTVEPDDKSGRKGRKGSNGTNGGKSGSNGRASAGNGDIPPRVATLLLRRSGDHSTDLATLTSIWDLLEQHSGGPDKVLLSIAPTTSECVDLELPLSIKLSRQLQNHLGELLGDGHVTVTEPEE